MRVHSGRGVGFAGGAFGFARGLAVLVASPFPLARATCAVLADFLPFDLAKVGSVYLARLY